MNSTLEVIKSRRSVRAFKSDVQLKDEDIDTILEAGAWAPSAHNGQPTFFTVIQNKDVMRELNIKSKEHGKNFKNEIIKKMCENEKLDIFHGAPTIVIVSYDKTIAVSPADDTAAATQNMLLAAQSMGIGSCWIGIPRMYFAVISDEDKEKFGIPKNNEPHNIVALGYSKVETVNAPKREKVYKKIIK